MTPLRSSVKPPLAQLCKVHLCVYVFVCLSACSACFVPLGTAIRHCDPERGWLVPDLFNCTSPSFVELNAAVIWLHLLA